MTKARGILAVVLALFLVPGAHAAVTATLKPADQQPAGIFPYRAAELTIDNQGPSTIGVEDLRLRGGGPIIRTRALIAPQTTRTIQVDLPAVAVEQTWRLRLTSSDSGGPDVADLEAGITWPVQWVAQSREAFFPADAYHAWESRMPSWPGDMKRNVLLVLVLAAVACGGAMFIRKGLRRLAAVLVILAIAAGGVWIVLGSVPKVEVISSGSPEGEKPVRPLVVGARRTTRYQIADTALYPVYDSEKDMRCDTLMIDGRNGMTLRIPAGAIRIFGRCGPAPVPATSPADK
ncbi:MAG: hypothetical protein ACE15C_04775 [Phycisphaerae bacterium]